MVTVGQLMKKELVTVDSGTSVTEAAKLMKTCNVGSVLIYQDNRVIGMVTESDIVKKVVGSDRSPYFIPVEDIMSSPIVGIEERRPLTEAADLMNRHHDAPPGCDQGRIGGGYTLCPRVTSSCLHRRVLERLDQLARDCFPPYPSAKVSKTAWKPQWLTPVSLLRNRHIRSPPAWLYIQNSRGKSN